MDIVGYVMLAISIVLVLIVIALLVILIKKKSAPANNNDSLLLGDMDRQKNEIIGSINSINAINATRIEMLTGSLGQLTARFDAFMANIDAKIEGIRKDNNETITKMRQENTAEMEKMREVVDQKLSENIEKRFNASFKQVTDRMAELGQSLAELQTLQSSVKDLNGIFNNVKTRGTWGEVSLESLLSQILSPEQYRAQYAIDKKTGEQGGVDFAIILPGKDNGNVILPMDAKFPLADYERLISASESGDKDLTESALKALISSVKNQAKSISEKYIKPPITTDFAVMYLPTEGLYAEIAKQPGLLETLQNQYRIIVGGPSTTAALLNSLRVGFKTMAMEKRSKEIADVLVKFQKDFSKFEEYLDKMSKNISTLQGSLEDARKKNTHIQKTLNKVSSLDGTGTPFIDTDDPEIPQLGVLEDNDD